ncbi:MAG: hypothetical protein AB7E26_09715, partial [Chryseobacterium sp.]
MKESFVLVCDYLTPIEKICYFDRISTNFDWEKSSKNKKLCQRLDIDKVDYIIQWFYRKRKTATSDHLQIDLRFACNFL